MRLVDSRNWELLPQRPYIDDLAPLCAFIEPVQDIDSRAPFSRIVRDLWAEVCVVVVQFTLIGSLRSASTINRCRDIIGPLVDIDEIPTGFRGLFQNGLNTNSFVTFLNDVVGQPEEQVLSEVEYFSSDDSIVYRSPSHDAEPSVQSAPAVDISSVPTDSVTHFPRNSDISLHSPHQSSSTESSMHFNTDDIPLGTETAVEQILFPNTAAPTTDLSEQIDDLEKASANACTQQDQDLRGHFKSVRQEIQIQKTTLSFEVLEFKQGVRAQSGILSTELADIRKEIKDQTKEFEDKLAAIHSDLLEFRVATQEQYATLRDDLVGLIAFVTRGRDDKKGKVGSIHGRGQPPSGDGGSSGSRSEPSRKRGSGGSKQRDWRYLING
ncbi:hypothetical protein F511_28246 [Dorcoceras hygrometricum]|uniref:Uncharacterized protein n=1 Tax=Dorcoceras hygrometricum TaxID=472368 RepID=A0A2Z7AH40_9LAMI|nr:hypothetical protein F511_28246 [Dorcoceras hygrometricum]